MPPTWCYHVLTTQQRNSLPEKYTMLKAIRDLLEKGPDGVRPDDLPYVISFCTEYVIPKYGSLTAYIEKHTRQYETQAEVQLG